MKLEYCDVIRAREMAQEMARISDQSIQALRESSKFTAWIVGFSGSAIALVLTSLDSFEEWASWRSIQQVLYFLTGSLVTGVIQRWRYLAFEHEYQEVISHFRVELKMKGQPEDDCPPKFEDWWSPETLRKNLENYFDYPPELLQSEGEGLKSLKDSYIKSHAAWSRFSEEGILELGRFCKVIEGKYYSKEEYSRLPREEDHEDYLKGLAKKTHSLTKKGKLLDRLQVLSAVWFVMAIGGLAIGAANSTRPSQRAIQKQLDAVESLQEVFEGTLNNEDRGASPPDR